MEDRDGGAPKSDDAERHAVERIMRTAEAMGHDPARVARALSHSPPVPRETQAIAEVKRPFLARLRGRSVPRRP